MAEEVNSSSIPETDSIQELADFWDTHDLADFQDQLEEVTESVFERKTVVQFPLDSKAVQALNTIAKAKAVEPAELIEEWVREKLAHDQL